MISGLRTLPKMFSTPLSRRQNNTADPHLRKASSHSHYSNITFVSSGASPRIRRLAMSA